jgi:hypothetical protein
MSVPMKVGLVAAGYLGAALAAAGIVAIHVATTSGPDSQAYSGMYAFGDSLLFLAVFGVCALLPTGAGLFFLRVHQPFWHALSSVALVIATTGLIALFIYVSARDPHASPGIQYWSMFAILRILVSPLLALVFALTVLFAPTRRARVTLLLATLTEAAVSATIATMWFRELRPQLTAEERADVRYERSLSRSAMDEDIVARLERAIPRVEGWMHELHAAYAQRAQPASTLGYAGLARAWPANVLSEALSVSVDRTPFPPVSEFALPEFESMAQTSWAGITFGHMYFTDKQEANEATHFHELCHVVQWKVLGVRDFLLTYAMGILSNGYTRSPFEAIAYELQVEFEAGRLRSGLVDFITVHARDAHAAVVKSLRSDDLE